METTTDTPHYENLPFEVPSSWVWTTVNGISKSILYGVSESAKASGKYKLLRITDIQNNSVHWDSVPYTDFDENKANSYLLNDGDILFARTGATVGKSYLVQGLTEEAIYASYLIRVQTYDVVLPQYVKFYFESGYYWEQIEQESVGVGQPNVNGTILGNLHIPIPPIHEQCRIVSELTKWMGIIDVIEQGKTDLQTVIKQAKSKILDLAIHGKLVSQNPTDEPASELIKRINPKAEITCDNGHYQNLPNGWAICKLSDLCKIENGFAFSSNNYKTEGTPLVRISNIVNNSIDLTECVYIQNKTDDRFIVSKGDLLIAMSGAATGKMGIYSYEEASYLNQRVGNIKILYNSLLLSGYRDVYMQSKVDDILKLAYGGAQPNISAYVIGNFEFLLPPIDEQKRIIEAINIAFEYLDVIMESL
ncbi:MAG: restriction endonuclease subunit S [Bacteroidaceae bacterium]|nr:restriction endonuclease subunit S [Bacteroidaceae bacterium]